MMQNSLRRYLVAGNWKMNNTSAEAVELFNEINIEIGRITDVAIAVCPPFTALESIARLVEGSNIQLGAQNMHQEISGAFTGEISASMLRGLFCSFVILGHSERRSYFGESDSLISEKVKSALGSNLKPILCVGETLEEREEGKTWKVIERQVNLGLGSIDKDGAERLVVAYEPVWTIGTGRNATPEMAQETHQNIRGVLTGLFSENLANRIRIIYGGSMKPQNASDLLDQPDIDGGLIGGASLDPRAFIRIVEIALEKVS